MGFPEACDICVKDRVNVELFEGNLELAVKPIIGANPSVFLVGQDPTLTRRQLFSVLDLDNPQGRLYGYIINDIFEPLGVTLDDIYATDLIKCRFPDYQTPKAIAQDHGMTTTEFLSPFFSNCQQWFVQEVHEIRPKIIMSLGEPVHQLLVEEFVWAVPTHMKEAFSNIYIVNVLGHNAFYAPCIHFNSKGYIHYKNLWDFFIQNLGQLVQKMGIPS